MKDVILRGAGVTKHFGALKAVTDIDFEARQGEILGIIGPNGAGKTTFLSLINGTLPLTRGAIFFRDEKISGLKPYQIAERGISRTFQIVKPFPGMTVLENVAIGALFGKENIKDAKKAREKTRSILSQVHLEGKEELGVETLNISERKRLELARALAMNPEVLLLDEVMAGLNLTEIESIMELISALNREGRTILVIEHVLKAIMALSHRVIVLHHGEKIAEGDPATVTSDERVISAYLGERYAKTKGKTEELCSKLKD
ncbi:MAG: ABC transporter ATP-binding protein [Spirochaetaceae bacterium]|jgi:branched-chain amino acid transport system ATP-binding protein|nr:ABC transporter ATP-binding protein [Spirochaetaceae bacterium]